MRSIWPPLIYLVLTLVAFGSDLEKHGKTEEKTTNAWISAGASVLLLALLWWGGFFEPLFHR